MGPPTGPGSSYGFLLEFRSDRSRNYTLKLRSHRRRFAGAVVHRAESALHVKRVLAYLLERGPSIQDAKTAEVLVAEYRLQTIQSLFETKIEPGCTWPTAMSKWQTAASLLVPQIKTCRDLR
jgi:hypothetical protein